MSNPVAWAKRKLCAPKVSVVQGLVDRSIEHERRIVRLEHSPFYTGNIIEDEFFSPLPRSRRRHA